MLIPMSELLKDHRRLYNSVRFKAEVIETCQIRKAAGVGTVGKKNTALGNNGQHQVGIYMFSGACMLVVFFISIFR